MQSWKIFFEKYLHNPIALCAVLSILLTLAIESLGRRSFVLGLQFLAWHPAVLLMNAIIIAASLSTALLFRRRILVYTFWSLLWLALGVTNGVILGFRMTPFTTADLELMEAGLSILPNYFSNFQIGLLIGGVVLIVVIFVVIFLFAPRRKEKINYPKNAVALLIVLAVTAGTLSLGVRTGAVDTFFPSLPIGYRENGVVYCFMNTWLNKGIHRPRDYSEETVKNIFEDGELAQVTSAQLSAEEQKALPNIIFLQLESFVDPTEFNGLTFSQEPVPFFRELKKNFPSGHLTVPSLGAGTANTEFEVITGMNVKNFGPGEYPYKSILKEETAESVPYVLKNLGYRAHAIHNHRGAFYGRNKVFAHLGFDTFTSLEYMNYVTKTPRNWARDDVLERQILSALQSTEGHDYIYTVSVQGHGGYPANKVIDNPRVKIGGLPTEAMTNEYEYYVEQMNEMDDFLASLTAALEALEEDVVLVMYGDHLPAFDVSDEDMASGSYFNTEYVIWSNFPLPNQSQSEDRDLFAYQLSAEVLRRTGIHEGTLMLYHQNHLQEADYEDSLKMLQYDMLYGKHYIYGGENPFQPTKLQMGFTPIKINEIIQIGDRYYISGEGFTPFSKVSIDGRVLDTIFLEPTILNLLEKVEPEDVANMKVSQVEKNKEILSTTE